MKKGCFFREVERPSQEGPLTWKSGGVYVGLHRPVVQMHHLTLRSARILPRFASGEMCILPCILPYVLYFTAIDEVERTRGFCLIYSFFLFVKTEIPVSSRVMCCNPMPLLRTPAILRYDWSVISQSRAVSLHGPLFALFERWICRALAFDLSIRADSKTCLEKSVNMSRCL
jgi:hypothetical protein